MININGQKVSTAWEHTTLPDSNGNVTNWPSLTRARIVDVYNLTVVYTNFNGIGDDIALVRGALQIKGDKQQHIFETVLIRDFNRDYFSLYSSVGGFPVITLQ